MLELALIGSATLMGLAGTPHCALMCSAPCAAVCGAARERRVALLAGRVLSYTLGGAVAAATAQGLVQLTQGGQALRPVWALAHAALLMLGITLLVRGHQPAWLSAVGQQLSRQFGLPRSRRAAFVAGLAWVAWPCGLLQSALLVAALTAKPWAGAAAMGAFALASSLGLWLAPALLARLPQGLAGAAPAVRLAGLGLAAASGWALVHGVWQQVTLAC